MKVFYKVNLYSEDANLKDYNTKIIVSKCLLFWAKELSTHKLIMICDNKTQGAFHDYYVLSSEFNLNNVARYDEILKYIENFKLDEFPIYTKKEAKKVKKFVKETFNRKQK